MYLLWKDEMLLQPPFLKLMTKVCIYPLIFCFLKMPANVSSVLIPEDAGRSQRISQVLKVRFMLTLTGALKKLVRATACVRAG